MDGDVIEKFHKQKLEQEMKEMAQGVVNSFEEAMDEKMHGKMVKTVPMRPEWLAAHNELHDMAHSLIAEMKPVLVKMSKMKQKRNLFWASVQCELDDFRDMQINEETKDIEIFER